MVYLHMTIKGTRGDKGIIVSEKTLWKKTEIAVLAYFSKQNNKPATYTEIARAYISSSRSNYQKACESLRSRGYLKKLEKGRFRVQKNKWEMVKTGTEQVERRLPYFDGFLFKLLPKEKQKRLKEARKA